MSGYYVPLWSEFMSCYGVSIPSVQLRDAIRAGSLNDYLDMVNRWYPNLRKLTLSFRSLAPPTRRVPGAYLVATPPEVVQFLDFRNVQWLLTRNSRAVIRALKRNHAGSGFRVEDHEGNLMPGFDVGELEYLLLVRVPILDLRGKCEVVPDTAESISEVIGGTTNDPNKEVQSILQRLSKTWSGIAPSTWRDQCRSSPRDRLDHPHAPGPARLSARVKDPEYVTRFEKWQPYATTINRKEFFSERVAGGLLGFQYS
ncbi:hypothetical protein EDD16DRAFT_1733607 [Pisolithus croceorrhizus]|nr:hypothetical protein EDD16DRAFT_1733607 [Pisolithus croceorrhizus]